MDRKTDTLNDFNQPEVARCHLPLRLILGSTLLLTSCASERNHVAVEETVPEPPAVVQSEEADSKAIGSPALVSLADTQESDSDQSASPAPVEEFVLTGFSDVEQGDIPPPPVPPAGEAGSPENGLTPTSQMMSLGELEQIALNNNPTLALQRAEIEKERGNWTQVGLYPNPTVGYVNSTTSSNGDTQSNGVLVQQTFITAGKLEKARATETYGIQTTQLQLDAQQLRVINDVRLRYYDVLGAQEQLKLIEEIAALSGQTLDAANRLYRAQQVPETDVLQARAQDATIRAALTNARVDYETAWQKLAVIAGCPDLPASQLTKPEEDLPEFDLESEWQRMLAESPQLQTAESQIGIARGQLASAEAAPVPDLTLQFVTDYNSIGNYATFNTLMALPLPVFNRNQGGIYNAASEVHRTENELERVKLVLRDQLITSYRNYMLARNQAEQMRKEVLPDLKQALELMIKGYENGQFSYLAVLNAQQNNFQSNLEYIDSLNRAHRLAIEISGLQMTGGLNPATIGTAIQEVGGGGRLRAVQQQLQKQSGANLSNFAPAALQ
ncbi:Cobalt-zinc-cadmium resistance protein CzcC precursor [Gimesia panareensis]|uniref:Cobalt-zinc-cadmium resistance protein CzcC n=1 Tax=Gimesia panareensis TaxID=2527978 RepID=A0A518FVW5_9PLAN|nr:TolC family protein [Gimesia panareensis]QDV20484.1 Cobalt-zinc-cadmium resistance protein CzcC precursor [Gimesia panareensis]